MHPRGEKHPTVGWLFWMTDLNWLRERQIFPWNEDAYFFFQGFPGGSALKSPPANAREAGWEDPPEGEMAAHSSFLAWEIPWTEEPGVHGVAKSCTRLGAWAAAAAVSVLSPCPAVHIPTDPPQTRSSTCVWKCSEVSGVMELPSFLLVSFWGHMSSELKKRESPRWVWKPAHLLLKLPLAWFLAPWGESSPSPGLSVAVTSRFPIKGVTWVQGSQNLIVAFLKEQVVKLMMNGY